MPRLSLNPAVYVPLGIDPPLGNQFLLEVDGVSIGVFNHAEGISVELETETIKEGGQNGFVHKVPGRMVWPNIVLSRGLTQSNNLFDWFEKASGQGFAGKRNKLSRHTGAVTIVNHLGIRLRSWSLVDVFPVKWSGPSLGAENKDPALETLEIAHHGFTAETLPAAFL